MPTYGTGSYGDTTNLPSNPSQLNPSDPGYSSGITPQGNAYANNAVNQASQMFGSITSGLREANEAAKRRIDAQTAGQVQEARDLEYKSQNFARARLGKIGGFEGTYGIGLQNSITNRTEKNIAAIKRAGEEAKAAGDMDLAGRLNELGLQQMQLVAELNRDAFERSKFDTQMAYDRERDIIEDAREQAIFDENVRQFGLQFAEDQRQFNLTNSRLSGDGTGDTSGLPKGFVSAAEDARNDLLSGQEWGAVWNRIKAQFPNVANDTIDTFLQGRAGTSRELVASMLDDGTGVQQVRYIRV